MACVQDSSAAVASLLQFRNCSIVRYFTEVSTCITATHERDGNAALLSTVVDIARLLRL
jgi:hypothetical protein